MESKYQAQHERVRKWLEENKSEYDLTLIIEPSI
jgi:hypothetical protein